MSRPLSCLRVLAGVLLAALSASAQYGEVKPVPENVRPGFDAIEPESCRTWLAYLAGEACEGRGTGSPGYLKAAEYVAARFSDFGLKPVGDEGTYFQYVPFARIEPDADRHVLRARGPAAVRTFRERNGIVFAFGHGEVSGPVVVVNARGEDARLQDPAALAGKIVILRARDALRSGIYGDVAAARPLAVFRVQRRPTRISLPDGSALTMATDLDMGGTISEDCARDVLRAMGEDPDLLDDADSPLVVTDLKREIEVRKPGKRVDVLVPNVVGYLEGADLEVAGEHVIVGSHLDHLGKVGKTIYYGADDDGSGSAGLLAVAKAMTSNPARPRRGVLFIAVCGEEIGLLGSRYYVENPIFPLKDAVCELQMDMIGRNEEAGGESAEDNRDTTHVVGSRKLSMELHEILLKQNEHVGFKIEYDQEDVVYERSDHYNFAKMGIPVAFVFSGFHPDYHKPTDTIEKINFEKLVSTARLFYLVAHTVADMPRRIVVDSGPMKTATDAPR